jgi:hypothetical protein
MAAMVLAILVISCVAAHAQSATPQAADWDFSAEVSAYVVPDGGNYVESVMTADRRGLHLEGRYNYEDLRTASVWIGYNVSVGRNVSLQYTPMVGGVFGNMTGIAPGQRITLDWRRLEFYTENELVFNTRASEHIFYSWSELTISATDWLRIGLVGQRARIVQTDRDFDRGLLLGFNCCETGVRDGVCATCRTSFGICRNAGRCAQHSRRSWLPAVA